MKRFHSGALAAIALCTATPAISAVVTTGCVADCTLSELFAGGTIQVDDVLFSGFDETINDGIGVDADNVTVAGSSTASSVSLAFTFSPDVSVGGNEFLEYDLDYLASIVAPSSRIFVASTLDLLSMSRIRDAFVEVNTELTPTERLSVEASTGGLLLSDSAALADLTSLALSTDIQSEAFEADASASLGGFQLSFELDGGDEPGIIPLPAGFPLLLAGLGALALLRRR